MRPPVFHAQLPSRIGEVGPLLLGLQEWLAAEGVPAPTIRDATLMLDELITNTVLHGYKVHPDGWIEVLAQVRGASLLLTLRDRAPAFDPRTAPHPDPASPLDLRPIGGLGLMFVRRLSDEIDYRRLSDPERGDINELCITRHFAQPAV